MSISGTDLLPVVNTGHQLPLFPGHSVPPPPLSEASLARHFSRFSGLYPRWLERGVIGLPALSIAFVVYLSSRRRGALSASSASQAAAYARRRAALLWLQGGKIGPEDVPPELMRQLRRRELRALVHEALGRHLKTVCRDIQLPFAGDPIPELLVRYSGEMRRLLDNILGDHDSDGVA